jgi:hypothetical protein
MTVIRPVYVFPVEIISVAIASPVNMSISVPVVIPPVRITGYY